MKVDIDKIEQNENSRVAYKESDLSELMHSMKKDGLLQPVGVRKIGGGKYEAVFGNRRILAAQKLGWSDIAVHIVNAPTDIDRDILNLIENFKRQNTTVSEDGRMFQALKDRGLSESEIGTRLGVRTERIRTALEVFNEVPKEFHKIIVNSVPGKRQPNRIPANTANAILNMRNRHKINRSGMRSLLNFAKEEKTSLAQVQAVGPFLKSGGTIAQAIRQAERVTHYELRIYFDRKMAEKLEKKHGKRFTMIIREKLAKDPELKGGWVEETDKESPTEARA